jgi:hypothetical protein
MVPTLGAGAADDAPARLAMARTAQQARGKQRLTAEMVARFSPDTEPSAVISAGHVCTPRSPTESRTTGRESLLGSLARAAAGERALDVTHTADAAEDGR